MGNKILPVMMLMGAAAGAVLVVVNNKKVSGETGDKFIDVDLTNVGVRSIGGMKFTDLSGGWAVPNEPIQATKLSALPIQWMNRTFIHEKWVTDEIQILEQFTPHEPNPEAAPPGYILRGAGIPALNEWVNSTPVLYSSGAESIPKGYYDCILTFMFVYQESVKWQGSLKISKLVLIQ
jgi:hypothetical protein